MAPKDIGSCAPEVETAGFSSQGGFDGRLAGKARKRRKDVHRRLVLERLRKGGTCLEIGVWRGDFSQTLLETLQPRALTLLDAWADPGGRAQTESLAAREAEDLDRIHEGVCERFAGEVASGQVSIVRAFSHDFLPTLENASLDFVYIDADHSFEGLTVDLELVRRKLKRRGIVMCDDYHRHGWWKDDVIRAVHGFLGRHAGEMRVRAISGAQIAIERMKPIA